MGRSLDEILAECLEAVAQGQRTIEDCLALYPQWSDRLEPLLRLASLLDDASFPGPDPAFQEAARERFLSAVRARQAAPAPSFIQDRLARAVSAMPWRLRPSAIFARPALAVLSVVLLTFLSFSSFVAATAGDSLPGDWRYPVKRLSERTRLTFTFGEDARRGYRISLAEERLYEVEKLASQEHRIGESLLRQLAETTEPLVQALEPNSVPPDQIERITDLTAKQQDVLDEVAPLVEEEAVDELEEARVVSSEGYERAVQALALARSEEEPPQEMLGLTTPESGTATAEVGVGASPTAQAEPDESSTAAASRTPEQDVSIGASATPGPEGTPVPGEPTGEPPSPTATPSAPEREVIFLPDDTTAGITWSLMRIGDFSLRVPAEGEGNWVVSTLTGSSGERILVGHRWFSRFDAALVIQVSTGQAAMHALVEGTVRRVSADELRLLVSRPTVDVISHVLESINAQP